MKFLNIISILKSEHLCMQFHAGKNYLQWNGRQAQLVITEPELCKEILENKDGAFLKLMPPSYMKKLKGDGLPRSVGAKWAKLRNLANHAYHGKSLKVNLYCHWINLIVIGRC